MHITVTEVTAERLSVYAARRRLPIGKIVEQWIRPHLQGMRLPTMPTDPILDAAETAIPEPEETGASGESGAVETLPITEAVTPTVEPVTTSDAKKGRGDAPRLREIAGKAKRA